MLWSLSVSIYTAFDVLKVRTQLLPATTPNRLQTTLKRSLERPLSLYSGLSAAITRQMTYTTLRLGIFSILSEDRSLSLFQRLGLGFFAGGVASFVTNPVEVAMVCTSCFLALSWDWSRNLKKSSY